MADKSDSDMKSMESMESMESIPDNEYTRMINLDNYNPNIQKASVSEDDKINIMNTISYYLDFINSFDSVKNRKNNDSSDSDKDSVDSDEDDETPDYFDITEPLMFFEKKMCKIQAATSLFEYLIQNMGFLKEHQRFRNIVKLKAIELLQDISSFAYNKTLAYRLAYSLLCTIKICNLIEELIVPTK